MSDRNAILLGGFSPASRLIEVGPSFSPVAPRREGWNTVIVDHASREALVAKYAGAGVDVARIEEVDVQWHGEPLDALFPPAQHGGFDGLIASHVIEHMPDPVAFLAAARRLLREDGVLALAVPDKRLCFDCLRPASTTGQVLAAHRAGATRHGAAALFDAIAYDARPHGGEPSWFRGPLGAGAIRPLNPLGEAIAALGRLPASGEGEYVDVHGWVFTPASFALLVLELGEAGVSDWRVETLHERDVTEFLVRLAPGRRRFASDAEREACRMALLQRMVEESREASDWLLDYRARTPAVAQQQLLDRLAALEALLRDTRAKLDDASGKLDEVRDTAAWLRTALRPARAAWRGLLPLRRVVARARGRIP